LKKIVETDKNIILILRFLVNMCFLVGMFVTWLIIVIVKIACARPTARRREPGFSAKRHPIIGLISGGYAGDIQQFAC
jgi:hypothetical protein